MRETATSGCSSSGLPAQQRRHAGQLSVALSSSGLLKGVPFGLYLAALSGITAGLVFNFLGNRYLVFRRRYVRK